MRVGSLKGTLAGLALWATCATTAVAHPHSWITVETTVLYANGAFVGLQHKWTFDEYYTAMAIEGLDTNKDGKYDREELAELAKANVDGLKDVSYFTNPALAGHELKFGEASDYWLEHTDGILSLHLTLPFAQPVLADAKGLTFTVEDPTFFIAFEFAKTDPVKLGAGAPKECRISITTPGKKSDSPLTPDSGPASAALGLSLGFTKTVAVECSGS
jgi:ABC-type uncharacterized transport system substrate-binding protein